MANTIVQYKLPAFLTHYNDKDWKNFEEFKQNEIDLYLKYSFDLYNLKHADRLELETLRPVIARLGFDVNLFPDIFSMKQFLLNYRIIFSNKLTTSFVLYFVQVLLYKFIQPRGLSYGHVSNLLLLVTRFSNSTVGRFTNKRFISDEASFLQNNAYYTDFREFIFATFTLMRNIVTGGKLINTNVLYAPTLIYQAHFIFSRAVPAISGIDNSFQILQDEFGLLIEEDRPPPLSIDSTIDDIPENYTIEQLASLLTFVTPDDAISRRWASLFGSFTLPNILLPAIYGTFPSLRGRVIDAGNVDMNLSFTLFLTEYTVYLQNLPDKEFNTDILKNNNIGGNLLTDTQRIQAARRQIFGYLATSNFLVDVMNFFQDSRFDPVYINFNFNDQ